jgi:hypothetical protein
LVAQEWEFLEAWGGTRSTFTLTGTGNISNNETVTVDGKIYTFKTVLTPAEGEVLIENTLALTLDNFKDAINRDTPGSKDGVKYKISQANQDWEGTTNTDTAQTVAARRSYVWKNFASMTKTCANASWSALVATGVDDHCAYRSNGESGNEPYGYIKILASSGSFRIVGYQGYDIGSHTGYRPTNANASYDYINEFANTYDVILQGDKDNIWINSNAAAVGTANTYRESFFGHVPKRFYPNIATTTAPITSGSHVSIPVDNSSYIPGVGCYFQIVRGAEGCDRLQVESIPDGTHVVVVSLPRNYATGAKCGLPASVFFVSTGNSSYNIHLPWQTAYVTDAGLTVSASALGIVSFADFRATNSIPGKTYMQPLAIGTAAVALLGYFDKGWWYGSGTTAWDLAAIQADGAITVTAYSCTSATSLTIVSNTQNWTTNQFAGKWVVLVSGTGNMQLRKIISNTATTITIAYAWYTTPDATTTFRVYDTLYRYCQQAQFSYSTYNLVTNTETPLALTI